ncbi:bifunctional 2-polyprenyl-6-hydroxyphenol methylase/3-demethylubiquinol 3-O-methyltransferase UbiG [Oscillatoria sp. HE19RPO]|uniref:class I SAM-dependent methyltransferase n=1 Tax=Oscillatoria sp. HE19RPO TaxID=2954806 RepID=UPI0020C4D83B|nr:class I SAM-dependent methyltransferase [Oscillatoria sp. HE19RPO]
MDNKNLEILEKIRQQFEKGPYPRRSIEDTPKDNYNFLFKHNLATPFYLRNQKFINSEGKFILDAGCGSGYKSLALAEANPGAKIIGIDISEESVKLARQRLEYYGFEADFYVLPIEEVASLGMTFDYINNDDVLYLLPNPVLGLEAMKSVLKPEGIIRTNFHSSLQRYFWYRAQEIFKIMGLMDENPGEMEISVVRDTMKALKDGVLLKTKTWQQEHEDNEEWYMMNYLFQGDKGYTIPEMFAALKAAKLEFISMVDWRRWELMELFEEPENLPIFLGMSLPELSVEERMHILELLHPVNRLLDFWCGPPEQDISFLPVSEWTDSDWQGASVRLHPQLRNPKARTDLLECITHQKSFEISRYVHAPTLAPIFIESSIAACLLPLWQDTQSVKSLVERFLTIRPVHPATLERETSTTAFETMTKLLTYLETFLYVLLERST